MSIVGADNAGEQIRMGEDKRLAPTRLGALKRTRTGMTTGAGM